MKPLTSELELLLRCARVETGDENAVAIRRMLEAGIDWATFAQKAVGHGLAGLAGQTLGRVAPDLIPADILDAFRTVIAQARTTNTALFDELARLIEALAAEGIPAIPFKGPVLALQAYGDFGLRMFRDLDFLIRDADLRAAIAGLQKAGYERQPGLTESQLEITHWIQGQEVMFRSKVGTCIEPHTRLTSIRMALNIDHEGLWRRAQHNVVSRVTMYTLAPEDEFIVLAIHGGKELWWNIKWACDAAAFVAAHPHLDWNIVEERARMQGCRRMVLLAASLARLFFDAGIPPPAVAAEQTDAAIAPMVQRIVESWEVAEQTGPVSAKSVSLDRLRLHDGVLRQAAYVARTWFLPGPHHAPLLSVPKRLRFLYVPAKLAHDAVALPIWRTYEQLRTKTDRPEL